MFQLLCKPLSLVRHKITAAILRPRPEELPVMAGPRPGHPRLTFRAAPKAWMAGTSPAMTGRGGQTVDETRSAQSAVFTVLRNALLALAVLQLAGCGSIDDRAQGYYERGMKFLEQQD